MKDINLDTKIKYLELLISLQDIIDKKLLKYKVQKSTKVTDKNIIDKNFLMKRIKMI